MTQAEKYAAIAANNEAIAANVPKVYKAGQSSMVDPDKLIPKTVSGNYISVDDVSEIPHSVGCKVESVNLFDKDNISALEGAYFGGDGRIMSSYRALKVAYVPCSPNTEYVVTKMKSARFAVGDTNEIPEIGDVIKAHNGVFSTEDTSICIFKTTETAKYICLWYYNPAYDTDVTIEEIEATIMLNKGTTALPYTPYVKPEEVKVTRCGRNLVNVDKMLNSCLKKNTDGTYTITKISNDTRFGGIYLFPSLPVAVSYTISVSFIEENATKGMVVWIKYEDGTDAYHTVGNGVNSFISKASKKPVSCRLYLQLSEENGANITFSNFQFELVGKATEYEPYNAQTLTPGRDGTVEGMTSVSPYMNVFADTEGVHIEVEYNKSWGMQTEYDRFWDAFQRNGTRTDYYVAFYSRLANQPGWNNENFKPKYPIKPTYASNMLCNSEIRGDLTQMAEIDFSNATSVPSALAYNQYITRVGVLDVRKVIQDGLSMVSYCTNLETIDEIILKDDGSQHATAPGLSFPNCTSLKNLKITGKINFPFNAQYSPLTLESAKSVINALKDYSGTDKVGTNTVTFSSTTIALLDAAGEIFNGMTWDNYVASIGWTR